MQIRDMFERDINRYINGVVSVGEEDTIKQELEEYVVTRELQRHFGDFFESYERGLANPERNVGVWIQGYFGSGKSHFLKMLSYLLENKYVAGKSAVDYFDGKFEDPMTFASVARAAKVPAETILFNIDVVGGGYKEGSTAETAVMRSIASAFYQHLGFYGQDYKLAKFEKEIDDMGKTDEFRRAYLEMTGHDWLERRKGYRMRASELAMVAHKVAGMDEGDIMAWVKGKDAVTIDFGELVSDINEYAKRREAECGGAFRLLFMVDEMGQYLNNDVNRMLNLQTMVELFCDKCDGRVWMVVTSQEAIDEMMMVVGHDFSKIQGRFSTRLSLSSSSVDEVIKKRVLAKNGSSKVLLEGEYAAKSAVLKNNFAFEDSRGDLKGYVTESDFVESFPFVGYQFTLMPSVLKEIRKHGYQGKSLSTGERSMLSSYQEAAQAVEDGNEGSLVPFWRFFDTLEKELDHGIKQVFERCRKAAEQGYVIQPQDLEVLKALYLINYISDVKPTIGNIAILLIDRIDVDKVSLRKRVEESLTRLVRENYAARSGERYSFLTDEEQDVAREIKAVSVDPASVIAAIQTQVFDGIYNFRKFHKGANDFPFDRYVDNTLHGASQNGMRLNVITMAYPELSEATDAELDLKSTDQALVVLDTGNDYYEVLHNAAKVKAYVKGQNNEALPKTKRDIIMAKQEEARAAEKEARGLLEEAIVKARVSIAGRSVAIPAANAKQKLDGVLEELVSATFTKADLIDAPIDNDGQLRNILMGNEQAPLPGLPGPNEEAARNMDQFLAARASIHQPTTMGDVQRHYQARPFGWREIDIAAVAAKLVMLQQATIRYGGAIVKPTDPKMKDYLRKQNEVDKVSIEKRKVMSESLVSRSRILLRQLDSAAQVPADEDGLVLAVERCMAEREDAYAGMKKDKYAAGPSYPGQDLVDEAIKLARRVLGQKADPEALLREFTQCENDLLDNKDDLVQVENFFNNQQPIFDDAARLIAKMKDEKAYIEGDEKVQGALTKIATILSDPKPYKDVPKLPNLCKEARGSYDALVAAKRNNVLDALDIALKGIEDYAGNADSAAQAQVASVVSSANAEAVGKRSSIHSADTCTRLDALSAQIGAWHSGQLKKIDSAVVEATAQKDPTPGTKADPPVVRAPKVLNRAALLPTRVLSSEDDVDAYVEAFRNRLLTELKDNDSIRLG